MTTNIYSLDSFRTQQEDKAKKWLSNAIFTLAQEAQGIKTVSDREIYSALLSLIPLGLNRKLIVETLERHDDVIDSNIRFGIIDIYDLIVVRLETSKRVQEVTIGEQSTASDKR